MKNSDTHDEKLGKLVMEIRLARLKPEKLSTLLEKYENEFGPETEQRVLEIIAEETKAAWKSVAERRGDNGVQGIIDTLWESFRNAGGEFTIERTENSAQIHCTRCPIADTYHKIGKPEYGLIFHCSTDPHIVAGFNPNMEFKRIKTLMMNDCCDHYYYLK